MVKKRNLEDKINRLLEMFLAVAVIGPRQCGKSTIVTQLDFFYFRTINKSEVDLMIDGAFGTIPIEIKLNSVVKRISLRGLERFLADRGGYGILINRGKRPELITDRIIQIPVNYI